MDPASWPSCRRYDGVEQQCWCWFGEQHAQIAPEDWPGGGEAHLLDFLSVTSGHECNAPFDSSGPVEARCPDPNLDAFRAGDGTA